MGGHPQARRIGAAAVWSLLLSVGLAGAGPAERLGLFPPQSTVVLLSGVPGDVESEASYRGQMQGWLEFAMGNGQAARVFVLCDDPQGYKALTTDNGPQTTDHGPLGPTNGPSGMEAMTNRQSSITKGLAAVKVLKGDRESFLSLGQKLAGRTNSLVVIAWGHGGRQGIKPVFHVRGPRITAADFKELAQQVGARDSRWVLMFRGSGSFAEQLAGEGRQIISSEGETMFNDDPIGMPLLLKLAKEKAELAFQALAEDLGRATDGWYKERYLARTEEPTFWAATDKPRHLIVVAAEEEAGEGNAESRKQKAESRMLGAESSVSGDTAVDLPPAWPEIKRVEPQKFPEADGVILKRRLSYTLGSSPAIATEQEEFVQVLTPEGKRYGDFDVSYSPPFEEISFLDCEVLRADGKLVRLNPDAIRDAREQAAGDYQTAQRKFFSLPGVGPGAVLHVRYRTTWKTFPLPHLFLEVPVGQELATLDLTLQVSVPKETAFHFRPDEVAASDPALKQTAYGTTYEWHFEKLPAMEHEALLSPAHRPRLLISTFPDWPAFEEWYGRISKLTDEVTPEIAAKAKTLTAAAKSDREKVLALYNYVTRLRYVAVPLGVNSFRPHAAANVLQNEYGDCKDKANLFNTLLRVVGIDARLALVPRFGQAYEDLPGFAFNHAISRVTLGGDTVWVDTTDDVCRFGMLPPGDPGRNVLVIGGGTNALTPLPTPQPSEHVLKVRGEVDCSGPLDALPIKLTAVAQGYPDYELRMAARETKEHASTLPLLAAKYRPVAGSFALEGQNATSVAALNEDFTWRAEGTCVGLFSKAGDVGMLRAPFWLPKEWDLALHRRKAALYLNMGYPLALEEAFEFTLPSKTQPVGLVGVKESTTAPLRWQVEWTKIGHGKLAARMRAELERGELTAAETPALQHQLRELMSAIAAGASLAAEP